MNYNIVYPAPTVEPSVLAQSPEANHIVDGWDKTPRVSEIPPSEINGKKVLPPGHIAFLSVSAIDAMIAHQQEM